MMRISAEPVRAYLELQKKLPNVLALYGISQKHIYSGIGMSRKTFERKIKNHCFSIEEMLDICEVLNFGRVRALEEKQSNKHESN